MSGFWGYFRTRLDAKGRINVPAKIRKNLRPEDQDTFILIRGTEKYISMHPLSRWEETMERIRQQVKNAQDMKIVIRRLMYQASEQTIDRQGRLNIPAELIEYAELDGDVFIIGTVTRLEIWNPRNFSMDVEGNEDRFRQLAVNFEI
ncbi:MAG: hypothetical protein GXO78_02265 [Calditrichaeota bacterium]|nr:hypothetical protein [Calditrichota bacterium]